MKLKPARGKNNDKLKYVVRTNTFKFYNFYLKEGKKRCNIEIQRRFIIIFFFFSCTTNVSKCYY